MATQSIMVPPNNTPWSGPVPGPQPPAQHPQPASTSGLPTASHAGYNLAHPPPSHSSSYPPPSPYYHHPGHHHHPPHSSHQQPYYSYHPYPTAPYPPSYPPAHASSHPPHPTHPAYHHPHYPSNHLQPPGAQDTISNPTSTSPIPSSSSAVRDPSPSSRSVESSRSSKTTSKTRSGKVGKESSDSKSTSNKTHKSATSPQPKTFRFEGSISSETYKTTKSFDLGGVNILNRKPLDARTALDKLQRRRETHNRVERKRRDCINQLVDDLTKLLPPKHLEETSSKCHRVNVLRGAVAHIKFLTETNSALSTSIEAAKNEGFKVPENVGPVAPDYPAIDASLKDVLTESKTTTDKEQVTGDRDMSMEIDESEEIKQEVNGDEDADEQLSQAEKAYSKSASPSASASVSLSPRLTPSRAITQPLVIVTNSPTPSSSDKDQSQPSSSTSAKAILMPPPISITTTFVDTPNGDISKSMDDAVSPGNSLFPNSPMFPPSVYKPSADHSSSSAFPPSPVSPSPSSRQNPFADGHQNSSNDRQLSPFSHKRSSSSTSPSLPPISSLASVPPQSLSDSKDNTPSEMRRSSNHQTFQPLSPMAHGALEINHISNASMNDKFAEPLRAGPVLPPLKIPESQHLHPSYIQGHANTTKGSRRHSVALPQHSPVHYRRHSETDHQPPVSPFMLSPMMSRSPSMGPSSASSAGASPYPHWGHESPDAPPPPPQGHYMPGSHPYPHAYPYPYPYHPSYGYPPHHGPPPPHHHPQHGPPPSPAPQQQPMASQPVVTRPPPPEPIFIQEEPWIVQRKRNTSNNSGKNASSAKQANKKNNDKEEKKSVEDSTSVPNPNSRKRSSQERDTATKSSSTLLSKRAKQQQQTPDDDWETSKTTEAKEDSHQKENNIAVIAVETDGEVAASDTSKTLPSVKEETSEECDDRSMKDTVNSETKDHEDAAQVLTSLAQNST